jgi:hypothetical protein
VRPEDEQGYPIAASLAACWIAPGCRSAICDALVANRGGLEIADTTFVIGSLGWADNDAALAKSQTPLDDSAAPTLVVAPNYLRSAFKRSVSPSQSS